MKFKFTPGSQSKFAELLKAAASKDVEVSKQANEVFASVISSSLSRVLDPQSYSARIFGEALTYDGENPPEIPLDPYFNLPDGAFKIWSNGFPGGLAYNEVSGNDYFRFRTVHMDTAIAWNRSYVESSVLPNIVERHIARLMDEMLLKIDYLAFSVLAEALGGAQTYGQSHVISSTAKLAGAPRKFQLDDISRLITKEKLLNASFANGTSRSATGGVDLLLLSPFSMEEVRRMVYNPMNTTAIPNTDESTAMPLPDELRMEVFRSGGASSLFGKELLELTEMSAGYPYSQLFRNPAYYTAAGLPTWGPTEELVVGINTGMNAFARVVRTDGDGNSLRLQPDDQHTARSRKTGYFVEWEGSFAGGNDRSIVGLVW